MRVLHVIPYVAANFGGPSQVIQDMVCANNLASIQADILTTSAGLDNTETTNLKNKFEKFSANLFIQELSRFGMWFYAPQLKEWLEKNISNYDLLHLHIPFTYPLAIGADLAREAKIPYIISCHGLLSRWCLKQKYLKKKIYLELFERRRINGASILHVTTSFEADEVALQNFTTEIKTSPLAVNNRALKKEKHSNLQPLQVVCVARLHPVKKLEVLIKAVAGAHYDGIPIRLEIAGEGPEAYLIELRKLTEALKVSDLVTFHGYLNTKEVEKLLYESDLFVILSSHENFCLSAAEALACGLPVILSDQVGMSDEVKKAGAGIIVPVDNVHETSNAIKQLNDPVVRQNYGSNGYKLVHKTFSIHSLSRNLHTHYSTILCHS